MTDQNLWASAPLFLHVGLHKTATSWLQAHVFTNDEASPFRAYKNYTDIVAQVIIPHETTFSAHKLAETFRPFVSAAADDRKLPVITSEELGGLPFHKRFVRTALAGRLAAAFPGAKVLITIREQCAVILSIYGQFVRYGYHNSLAEFLAEPAPATGYDGILEYPYYDYDALLTQYEGLFGVGNVLIAPFEIMTRTPAWLTDAMGKMADRTLPAPTPDLGGRSVNTADATQSRAIVRQMNRFISRDMRWARTNHRLSPNSFGQKFNKLVPKSLADAAKARDVETVRRAVGQRYAESNRRLAERLSVDLGALGYLV